MTSKTDSGSFFDESGRERGGSSARLKDKGDFVTGQIVELFERPYVKFGKKDPELDDDGNEKMQLVIILQTDSRNWDKVAKVPVGEDGSALPTELDKGLRAVYVPKFTNIYAALGKAIKDAGAKTAEVGGAFGIIIEDLEEVGKGNPKKVHRAKYDSPVKGVAVDTEDEAADPLAGVSNKPKAEAKQDTPATETKVADKVAEAKAEAQVEEPPF